MSIEINTTHTVTCDNAPVEEVYAELDEKFPQLNPLVEQKLQLREERDDARKSNQTLLTLNDALKLKVVELTRERDEAIRERDEVQKRLEESRAINQKLMAENKGLAARDDALDGAFETQQMRINRLERKLKEAEDATPSTGSHPALPEGMRIAEHPEYGRVVVSPDSGNTYCKVFSLGTNSATGAAERWVAFSDLTFLASEPEPAPLPKPEDCKVGELYLARAFGREVIAKRCHPMDGICPWVVSDTDINYANWCSDKQITLLARLTPDREVQA